MIQWNPLESMAELEAIIEKSETVPCLIFKHSTRCNISAMAKSRLERDWDFSAAEIEPYYLDLLSSRPVSKAVAENFFVSHESPQVLLIRHGECTYDAAHLDISVQELQACFAD